MIRLLFLSLFSFLVGCPRTESTEPRPERNYLEEIVLGLNTVAITSYQFKANAIENGNGLACSAWAGLGAASPVAARVLAQVGSGERFSEIPGVSWDASDCAPLFAEITLGSSIGQTVASFVSDGLATVDNMLTLWAGPFKRQSCVGYYVAIGVVDYARNIVPQILDALRNQEWNVNVPPVSLSFSECPEVVVEAPSTN